MLVQNQQSSSFFSPGVAQLEEQSTVLEGLCCCRHRWVADISGRRDFLVYLLLKYFYSKYIWLILVKKLVEKKNLGKHVSKRRKYRCNGTYKCKGTCPCKGTCLCDYYEKNDINTKKKLLFCEK